MAEESRQPNMVSADIVLMDVPWIDWMKASGLLKDGEMARRIIIDIEKGQPVKV